MTKVIFFGILAILAYLLGCSRHVQTKDEVLREALVPMVQDFIQRNGLPCSTNLGTNAIKKYEVHFGIYDVQKKYVKDGYVASLKLTNGYLFDLVCDSTNSEIWNFHAGIKTSYNLARASKEQIEAVKALSLRNKLNDKTALELCKHYFRLQGHKDEDFHPPEFGPFTWGQKSESDYIQYPFYMAQWYRKDADVKKREEGELLPNITITVSGITSNLVDYSKCFMPVGKDF